MCASFIEWKMMASAPSKAHMEPEHDGWLWGIDDQTKMADVASRCCFHNISTGSSTLRILIEFRWIQCFLPNFHRVHSWGTSIDHELLHLRQALLLGKVHRLVSWSKLSGFSWWVSRRHLCYQIRSDTPSPQKQPWAKVIGMWIVIFVQCNVYFLVSCCVMNFIIFHDVVSRDFPMRKPPDLRSFKAHHLTWHHKECTCPMSSEMFP